MDKQEEIHKQLRKSIEQLKDVLEQEKNIFIRDSAIKRFEITFDLAWKLLKDILENKYGVICKSPKGCFREAYKQGIIKYNDFWIKLTDWRNQTVHIYNEEAAEELYNIIPETIKYFEEVVQIKSE